jgi:hypothetical protein
MFIVFGTLILFYGLLFWYADHQNRSKIDARNSLKKHNNE